MKFKSFTGFAVIILLITFINSCKINKNESIPVLELMEKGKKAWNNGDIDGYMATYLDSDTLVFIGGDRLQKGWKQTIENYKNAYPSKAAMGTLEYGSLKVELATRDKAVVTGSWKLNGLEKTPSGYFTLLLVKTKSGWKIYRDHTS